MSTPTQHDDPIPVGLCHNCRCREAEPIPDDDRPGQQRPGVLCTPCIDGDWEQPAVPVSPLRARVEARLGMRLYDDAEQRADAADLWYERHIMGERPDRKPDPTRQDRAAA